MLRARAHGHVEDRPQKTTRRQDPETHMRVVLPSPLSPTTIKVK